MDIIKWMILSIGRFLFCSPILLLSFLSSSLLQHTFLTVDPLHLVSIQSPLQWMINPTHQVQFIHHSPIPWMSLISTFLTPLLKQVIPGCSCLISLCFLSIRWCTTYKQKSLSLSLPPSLFLRLTAFCFLIIPESCVYGTRGFSSHCENKQETQSGDHSKEKQPGK